MDVEEQAANSIGFVSHTNLQTKAAENSGATALNNLEDYQTSFEVWGYKNVRKADGTTTAKERVFNQQDVDWNSTSSKWTYSPIRFWDKQATSYEFYAAAPKDLGWVMADGGATFAPSAGTTTYKLSLTGFAVDGDGIAVDESTTLPASPSTSAVMPNNKDIMISEDITGYRSYSESPVNLHFIHILSRLNIGIKKDAILGDGDDADEEDDYIVKLKSIQVYNLLSTGNFNEGATITPDVLANGTVRRWSNRTVPITDGFTATTTGGVAITTSLGYVYQALVLPQNVDYQTIDLDGQAHDAQEYYSVDEYNYINGTSITAVNYADATYCTANSINKTREAVSAADKPYIVINYTITPNVTDATTEEYVACYNLAATFGKNKSTVNNNGTPDDATDDYNYVSFNEGWMNTLNITIHPLAISFDADVYEWKEQFVENGHDIEIQ
jgi:hypothetical protein